MAITLRYIAIACMAVFFGLTGCGVSQSSDLSVTGAWARPVAGTSGNMRQNTPQAGSTMTQTASATSAPMEGPVSAAYMTIVNKGGQADKLIEVTSSAAGVCEVHETKDMGGGMMGMQPVQGGLEIPANGGVSLKPGSYHVMMMNLHNDLKAGQTITMNLRFQSGKQITLDVPIKEQP